jgi:hypothetical protein
VGSTVPESLRTTYIHNTMMIVKIHSTLSSDLQQTEGINGCSKVWRGENPHNFRQQQLPSLNVGIWCGVMSA